MNATFTDDFVTIYHGDCLKVMRGMEADSIGIDLEREHCEIAWGRLSQGVLL